MQHRVFRPGDFVGIGVPPHDSWGVGKLVRITGSTATVQFFNAPGADLPTVVECGVNQLRAVRIPAQSRVWRRHAAGRWQVGRVLEDDGRILFVQFPNGDTVNVDVAELQIRWNRPLQDPLSLLCAEATETPFLADARSAFVREVSRQRTAVVGVSALLSASIELEDYQFEVVRRVLTDPIQRYLLADEVGLGKTVEAGVIIRQHFLDDDRARAVVVVPMSLVPQWRTELSQRFGLDVWLDDFLHVVNSENLSELEEVIADAGLLVVDEAHHLSRQGSDTEAKLYDLLRTHCRRAPKLLLLSATPVLSDEQGFLRVLHLLDPAVFPLDDLAGFRRRIESRQLVAEVTATLVPENLWGLGPELDRLQAAYGDDAVLCERIARLRAVLETFPEEEDETFLASLRELKTHLVESYRLHRRLLRNRRSAIPWATVGRAGARVVTLRTPAAATYAEHWESLRHALNELESPSDALAIELMSAALHVRAGNAVRGLLLEHGLNDVRLLALAEAVDRAGDRWREDGARFEALLNEVRALLGARDLQIVIFCDRAADADRAALALRAVLGDAVQRHEPCQMDVDDSTGAAWEAFLTSPGQIRVLVCDRRAEEGVNLHGGKKCAVHFDLPAAPNRIEQRLGRLDRYGKGDKVRSVIIVDEGHPGELLWARVVSEGWQVFGRSVASLQYLIESTMRTLATEWLHHGSSALGRQLSELDGPDGLVQQEFRQIEHQDALDALAEPDDATMDVLQDCDDDWRTWRKAFREFAFEALRFREKTENSCGSAEDDSVFRVGYARRDADGPTLLPLTGFLRHFLQSVDLDARGGGSRMPLSHRYAFSRRSVTPRAALARGVRLMRIGDPLVTALERFAGQDDRGRAFAVWRVDRTYEPQDASGADLFFRFDFVVHAQPMVASEVDTPEDETLRQVLERRAGRFLPPLFIRIWISGGGRVLDRHPDILDAPYHDSWQGTRRDFNLNPKRWRELPMPVRTGWMRDWPALCRQRREQAEVAVAELPAYQERQRTALAACDREAHTAEAQSAARLARSVGAARERELADLAREQEIYERLRQGLRSPAVHLDVVGAFFLSSEPLAAQ